MKKIAIAAGGTGGHLYPAQALTAELVEKEGIHVFFIGADLDRNPYFWKDQFPYYPVKSASLSPKKPLKSLFGLLPISKGVMESMKVLKREKPDLVVGFGSFHSFPSLIAAKLLGIPFIVHEANCVMGKVNRFFSRWAQAVTTYFPTMEFAYAKAVYQVQMPLRAGIKKGILDSQEAKKSYGFNPDLPVMLIFGGSHGAEAINQLLKASATEIKRRFPKWQVLHITGKNIDPKSYSKAYNQAGITHHVTSYEDNMGRAWSASNIVIARSGASTIAEAIEMEVPALLIPYPYATENHQEKNADYLVQTVKGAFKLKQDDAQVARFAASLEELLALKASMRDNIANYKKHFPKSSLSQLVLSMVEKTP